MTRRVFAVWVMLALLAPATFAAEAKAKPNAPRRRQTVAVFPFDNNSIEGRKRLDFLREWLPDAITTRLVESKQLLVVERAKLVRVLAEQKLGSSELASDETKLRLGRILGAQTMIFGGFMAIGGALSVDARIVDVESGVVLRSVTERGSPAEPRTVAGKLSNELVRGLGLAVAKKAAASGVASNKSLRAAEHYYRALAAEKAGKTDAAIEGYKKALELNANDVEAEARLKKLLETTP
jgi:curli biogenesis system outer membrane secretion channel CsgG